MAKKENKNKKTEYEELGKMIQNIYESGYLDKNTMYKMSFLKGVLAGLGGVIGATIVVALLLLILNLFERIPLIGPLSEKVQETVEPKSN